jgi:enoyl-[acyl-carrier protein] reductase I
MLSAGADFALPNYHAVGIAKAALAATLRYLARDLGELGVLCNGLSFSMLETNAAQEIIGTEITRRTVEHIAKRSLTGQQLNYEHVAHAAAFLAGADCQNLTGEVLTVDGGYRRGYF